MKEWRWSFQVIIKQQPFCQIVVQFGMHTLRSICSGYAEIFRV
jgi:hypothetical protein